MKAKRSGSIERIGLGVVRAAFERIDLAFREQDVDFGIDAVAELIEDEQATGRLVSIQIKSGPSYLGEIAPAGEIVFRTDSAHATYWRESVLPVVVCLCDTETDEVFWQVVSDETLISTGDGWKLLIPRSQVVDTNSRSGLMDVATPVVSKERYTVIGPEDTSHGLAKRYSFRVIVNGTATRSELAAIVRQVTADGAKRRYHRNDIAAQRWGDADAHIVHVYVAVSAAEYERSNYVCRSRWVASSCPDGAQPGSWVGEDVGDGVILIWNESHDVIAQLVSEASLTKEDFLAWVLPVVEEIDGLLDSIARGLEAFSAGRATELEFAEVSTPALHRIDEISTEHSQLGSAPYECSEVDRQLSEVLGHAANLPLYYNPEHFRARTTDNRIKLVRMSLDGSRTALPNLRYELSKVR